MNYINELLEKNKVKLDTINTVKDYLKENPIPMDEEFGWDLDFQIESLNKERHELKLLKAQAELIRDGLKGEQHG